MNKFDCQAGSVLSARKWECYRRLNQQPKKREKYDYQLSNDESFNEGLAVLEQKRETEKGGIETKSAATPDPTFQDLSSGGPGHAEAHRAIRALPAEAEQQHWRNWILSGSGLCTRPLSRGLYQAAL
jgi:hypothetical protein